ncbi:MAG: glycine cleavage system protein H [Rickettsiales bacterium]|nr:glycine cleavage system protein H [Rickettsiales bacterium]|tara:strand:+ start:1003 stop:1374 length:372 start_codon:yes stop_codon:yes gene_type:complete
MTLKYTEDHEWIKIENNVGIIGISKHAVDELGEIVFVELPELDSNYKQKEEFGSIESVKTVSSLYLPVSGKVIETNKTLENNPELINNSPEENGWIVKIEIENNSETENLLSESDYQTYLESL